MLVNTVDDMPERLKDEFEYFSNKYTNIAFNRVDWNGNVREDKDWLYAIEGYITIPRNYEIAVIKQYKGLITHNRKFANMHPELNIILTPGYSNYHNYYRLDSHKPYEERVDGVCSLQNIYNTGRDGDIAHLRPELIKVIPHSVKHTYGPVQWGDDYKGRIEGAGHPNHINNLKVINNYKFSLALESTFHPLWSYDWITGRLFNAFKSKTIPLYFGCYNIEEHVPSDLFIDLRKYLKTPFNRPTHSVADLKAEMDSYDKEKFEKQTERAFDWYENECKFGLTSALEDVYRNTNSL